jgi:Holliday junction resolvasome RuvABC endonuclease subunit
MEQEKSNVRVLCFDPALSCAGWGVIDFNPEKNKPVVTRFGSIKPAVDAAKVLHRDEVAQFGKRLITLGLLEEQVVLLMNEFLPDYIVVEDIFYNPKRPNAYAALLQWICVVDILCKVRFGKRVYKVPTRSAKQYVTGSGGALKISVRQAILDDTNVEFKQKKQAENLSDHEADALAVGLCWIGTVYPGVAAGVNCLAEDTDE